MEMIRPFGMARGHRSGLVYRRGVGPSSVRPSLLPVSLDDVLPAGHLVRQIRVLIEELFGPRLHSMWQRSGGVPHDPCGMLGVWLYGFMQGTATSRHLEELCRYDARYSHLSYGTKPDHTTLSRFRDRLSGQMDEMLASAFRLAKDRGLVGSSVVAVDGTKLAGKASQWKRAIVCSQDADAQTMRGGDGKFLIGYNVQAAVLMDSGYVAASHAISECNDERAASPLVEAMQRQSELPSVVVADAGYDTAHNHSELRAHGVRPVINERSARNRVFLPDEHGVLRCPAGHEPHVSHRVRREIQYARYRVRECKDCPLRASCGTTGPERSVEVIKGLSFEQAGLVPSGNPDDLELLRARGPTVELSFAILKQRTGFRRFRLGGLAGVNHEIRLWTLSHNTRLLVEAILWLFLRLLTRVVRHQAPRPGQTRRLADA